MRIVLPFGFYGAGNIGDEATLNGFAQLLAHCGMRARVSVGSRNPAHTARVEPAFRYFRPSGRDPRRWWAKLRASAHAVVGGTPIMDLLGDWPLNELTPLVRSTGRWQIPLAFVGVGIENLRMEKSRRIVVDEITPRVRHWSVRSDRDRQRLIDHGVPAGMITVAADLAWLIEPVTAEFGSEQLRRWGVDREHPLIGVNLVNENSHFEQQPQFVSQLAAALDALVERSGAKLLFLSNEIRADPCFDKAAAQNLVSHLRNADAAFVAPNDYHSPREMMSIIACCSSMISMRYHGCVFSALQGVPFFAIERSDKVADLCWDLAWRHAVPLGRFVSDTVAEALEAFGRNPDRASDELRTGVRRMRERTLRNVVALEALEGLRFRHPAASSTG